MLDTTIHQAWAAERKPSQKGNDAYRRTAEIFYARVGRKPVDEINKKDVLAFKAALLNDGFSNSNVKVYLSRLRTLLKFAEQNDYSNSNPAAGVSILDKDKDKNKRKSFDYTSLRAVFSSPVYSRGDRPPSGKGEAAYWLPILALFTGARLEELGQLRAQDVTELYYADEDGSERSAWFISIAVDAEDGLRVKNAKSERVIPVHPILERLGFLEYVQSLRLQGHRRVFPALRPGAYGRRTAKWGEWFGGYLRKVCLVTDRRLVFHSFRHTFKDCARHVGMPEGIQRQIMGHSGGDVADEYGEGYSLHQLVEAMKLYRIPGFKIAGRACEDS